jgi:energy-converting hydrogenase A subunit M
MLAEHLNIDVERALDILYNSRTFALLENPDSGLQLQSDLYILTDLLRELE